MRAARQFCRHQAALIILVLIGSLWISACSAAAAQQSTQTSTLQAVNTQAVEVQVSSLGPTETKQSEPASATVQTSPMPPEPSPSVAASGTPFATPCLDDLCSYAGLLFLQVPISAPDNNAVDLTYRFGSTQSGLRDPHHGVEFLNPFGTPVHSAGDGRVVVAGTDIDPTSARGVWPITFYGPYSNFYGNLVVIEHALPPGVQEAFPDLSEPIYTLYGHLSEISVQAGQTVRAGQEIGKVGMTGIATGSHLHFEVRVGENTYKASQNPELWLAPRQDTNGLPLGALAGRFLDSYGNYLEMPSITIQHLPEGPDGPSDFEVTLITYEDKGLLGLPPFQDSFGVGSLPAGLYRISFPMGGLREELVNIYPGQLTVTSFKAQ